jgi:hypothetical protein
MANAAYIFTPETSTGREAYRKIAGRVEHALQWRQKLPYGDPAWKRAIRLYRGQHWSTSGQEEYEQITSDNPRDRITVNMVGSHIEDTLPFLVRQSPHFILRPRNLQSVDNAVVSTEVMNYSWQELRIDNQLKMSIQDGLVLGHGVMKTGYNLEVDWDEANKPEVAGHLTWDSFIRKDEGFARRVNPFQFVFDPTAADRTLHSARWASEFIFKSKNDVLQNKLYNQSLLRKIKNGTEDLHDLPSWIKDTFTDQTTSMFTSRMSEEDLEQENLAVLYEVWDRKFEKYYLFAYGIETPLVEEPWKYPYLDGFPYAMWNFMPLNDLPYGPGMALILENQQLEKNRIRTTEFNNRRKHGNRKIAVHTGGLDEKELQKFLSDDDEVIELNAPVNQVISVIPTPDLPADNYHVDSIIDEDMRRLIGADQLLSGGSLPSRTSAREIDARTGIIGLKLQERVARVDEFVSEVANQLWQHIQSNMSTHKVVRIVGPEKGINWKTVTPEDVKGEFDMEMISTSKPEYDPLQERQQRVNMLQILTEQMPMMQQMGYAVNLPEVLKWTLESFDRVEADAFITQIPPQPAPAPGQEVSTEGAPAPGAQSGQGPISGLAGQALGGLSGGGQA